MLALNPLHPIIPLHRDIAQRFMCRAWADQNTPNFAAMLVNPEITAIPAQPKNLILIYLEGLEATYRHAEYFRRPLTCDLPLARLIWGSA